MSDTRSCQSCQHEFTIAPEDFAFYEKIEVPAPTWCPLCRAQRRMAWRNEWHLFRKPEAHEGKPIFSTFSSQSPVKIYDNDRWQGDDWDPMYYGREYDFSRPFFQQFAELMREVPLQSRPSKELDNSDYAFNAAFLRNCYLVSLAISTQDSAYIVADAHSRNCFDCTMIANCELCYDGLNLTKCYQTHYSINCENCRDVYFSKGMIGCQDCFGCVDLRNKQYYIFNKPYSKEEYHKKLKEFNLQSHESIQKLRKQVLEFWLQNPHKFAVGTQNEQVSGEYHHQSKNVRHGYRNRGVEDSKYTQDSISGPTRECYDCTVLADGGELCYESVVPVVGVYGLRFCSYSRHHSQDLWYSLFCDSSKDLFGCVSLQKKQYCILNKQYSKEEYEALMAKIKQHMDQQPYTDKLGRVYKFGEFFPAEMSPFEYNTTMAQEVFPLTKEQATEQGLSWYDQPERQTELAFKTEELPDSVADAKPEMVGKAIECEHKGQCHEECTGAFTIIPQELAFLMEQGLPLPRLCFNCRHYSRIKKRRGMKLHERQCQCAGTASSNSVYTNQSQNHKPHSSDQPCPNTFETSFSDDRPEIVYCQECYEEETV